MESPGLVASDVDGTLLSRDDLLTPRTRAAVHRVIAAGVPFVLVTGRPPRWLPEVTSRLDYGGLAVCANGAVIYDTENDRLVRVATLAPETLRTVAEAVVEVLPEAKFAVELPSGVHDCGERQFLAEPHYIHPWPGEADELAGRAEVLANPAVKLLIRQAGLPSELLSTSIANAAGDLVDITFSMAHGLAELSPRGVTKGSGLAIVADMLQVPVADVLAFGDMPNDLTMLRWAGHGVAMANAHPDVLAAADEVTAPNTEDGVALILERWF